MLSALEIFLPIIKVTRGSIVSYREKMTKEKAIAEIKEWADTQFTPEIIEVFLK